MVGRPGEAPYTNIQEAITAATNAGFGQNKQVTIEVKPGTYTENLSFRAGIHLKAEIEDALFSVNVIGTHRYDYNETGLGDLFISGIWFVSPANATEPTFSISGNGFTAIRMNHCVLYSGNNMPALRLNNTGRDGTRLSHIEMFHCRIRNTLTTFTGTLVEITAGSLLMDDANVSLENLAVRSFRASGASKLIIDNAEIKGRIETAGSAYLQITQSSIDSGAQPCIVHNGGTGIALGVLLISTLQGNVVTGSGTFIYNNIGYFYSAYGIAQTLSAAALPISTENARNLIYRADTPANWTAISATVPRDVNSALNLLVSGSATNQAQIDALETSAVTKAQDPMIISNGTVFLHYDTNDFVLQGQLGINTGKFLEAAKAAGQFVEISGDTMTGDLIMSIGTRVIGTNIIDSQAIVDLTISNEDIRTDANIAGSKVVAATTDARGTVQLATSTDTAAGLVVQANDSRLGVGGADETDPQVADNLEDNSVPRWNSTTTQLVTSGIYYDPVNARVGIGTVSPRGILDVDSSSAKDIYLSSYPDYNIKITGGDVINVVRDSGAASSMYLQYANNANVIMVAGGSAGNVGIGTTDLRSKLTVAGGVWASDIWLGVRETWLSSWLNQPLLTSSSPMFGGVEIRADNADNRLRFHDPYDYWYSMGIDRSDGLKFKINRGGNIGDNNDIIITPSGNVGIGITPHYLAKLDVNGHAAIRNVLVVGWNPPTPIEPSQLPDFKLGVNGHTYIFGNVYVNWVWVASDDRIKLNEQKFEYGLAQVMALEPKRYDRAEYEYDQTTEELVIHPEKVSRTNEIGLVAQEVQKIIPEAVSIPENENSQLWSLSYDTIIPVLVKAIQEQQAQIEELKQEIQAMKAGI